MLMNASAEIRGQGTKRPPRAQLGAGLCGGLGSSVGIEGLGLLGLFLLLSTYEFWIWVLGIPKVTRSLMSLIAVIGMLAISLHLDI
jgi:hypothetical protein